MSKASPAKAVPMAYGAAPSAPEAVASPFIDDVDFTILDSEVFVKGVHDGMAMATAVPMSAEELDRTMIVCEVLAVAVEPPSRRQSRIAATADLVASGVEMDHRLLREATRRACERVAQEAGAIAASNRATSAFAVGLQAQAASDADQTGKVPGRAQRHGEFSAEEEARRLRGGGGGGGGGDGRDTATVLVQVPEKGAPPGVLLSVALPGTGMSAMVPVPPGAEPGSVVEVTVCFAGVRESEVLAKMARLRKEAEKKIQRETEQEEISYKGLGDGEYSYTPAADSEEYSYTPGS